MAEQRKYRKFTAQQKLEIVLAGLRGDQSVRDVCREHEIAETLYYAWRDKLLEGGSRPSPARTSARARRSCRSGSASWSAALGRKTYELEIAGEALRGWE